jgi:hypothetical protein
MYIYFSYTKSFYFCNFCWNHYFWYVYSSYFQIAERQTWHTWSDNKVRELIAVKVLHTSLLNITVVAFKVLPLGSYAAMPAPSPNFRTILELVLLTGLQSCRRLLLMSSISSKCFPFNISFPVKREGVAAQLFVYYLKTPLQTVPCEQVHCREARSMSCWQKVRVVCV